MEQTKVVFNNGFGGFGLSIKAIVRFFELKGKKVIPYTELKKFGDSRSRISTFVKNYGDYQFGEDYYGLYTVFSEEDFGESFSDNGDIEHPIYKCPSESDIEENTKRSDPDLVRVVEELKEDANGKSSKLAITSVPKNTLYTITCYDGAEQVVTQEQLIQKYKWVEA